MLQAHDSRHVARDSRSDCQHDPRSCDEPSHATATAFQDAAPSQAGVRTCTSCASRSGSGDRLPRPARSREHLNDRRSTATRSGRWHLGRSDGRPSSPHTRACRTSNGRSDRGRLGTAVRKPRMSFASHELCAFCWCWSDTTRRRLRPASSSPTWVLEVFSHSNGTTRVGWSA
jgi:hypothetical protein